MSNHKAKQKLFFKKNKKAKATQADANKVKGGSKGTCAQNTLWKHLCKVGKMQSKEIQL